MSALEVNENIGIEDVQRGLSDALGAGYRVKASSASALRVTRNFVIWGTVHITWSEGWTRFRVRPGGLIVVAAINAVYTVPRIRQALGRAFPQAA
jgi:hypothetical protein